MFRDSLLFSSKSLELYPELSDFARSFLVRKMTTSYLPADCRFRLASKERKKGARKKAACQE